MIPHDISKRMMDQDGALGPTEVNLNVTANVNVSGANGDRQIVDLVHKGVEKGLSNIHKHPIFDAATKKIIRGRGREWV